MEDYNPLKTPNPEEWLALGEDERILLVREFHESLEELEEEALNLHATFHVIVENQIAENVQFIPETIEKLIRQGLDRHDAVHAIAAIISEDVFDLLKGNKQEFCAKQYRRKLEKITAKRWRKGQW